MIYYIRTKDLSSHVEMLETGLKQKKITAFVAEINCKNYGIDFSLEFGRGTDIREIVKEEKFIASSLGATPEGIKITTPVPPSPYLTITIPYSKSDEVKKEGSGIITIDTEITKSDRRFRVSSLLYGLAERIHVLAYKTSKK
jgi:hypothetical protein